MNIHLTNRGFYPHKNLHDPEDGADALDTAAPLELASVQASGVGTSHSLARADHAHQIQHSIADNHIVTIDGTTDQPISLDYAKFTASGLEGRSYAEVLSDIGGAASSHTHDDRYFTETEITTWRNSVTQTEMGYLNGIGSDIQTQLNGKEAAGISVLETDFDADTFLYATLNNTPVATSPANVLAALSGHAAATFGWNGQNLNGIGQLDMNGELHLIASTTEARTAEIGYGRTGNGYAILDLIGDATYSDYGLRIIRNSTGANAASRILHRGTGSFQISTQEAASLILKTSNADRVTIASDGTVTLSTCINAAADVNKFLVRDAGNRIDYRTGAELLADLSGDAAAAFAWNAQNLTGVGTIGCGTITTTGHYLLDNGNYVGISAAERLEFYTAGYAAFTGCNVGIGVTPNQELTIEGAMSLKEQATANADTAAYGQLWVKTATPNQLWFTDDAGTDFPISPAYITVSADSDSVDVTGKNEVRIDTTANNVTIGGFSGGKRGQRIYVYKCNAGYILTIEHMEVGGVNQIVTADTTDKTFNTFGGMVLIFDGTYWWEVGISQ